MSKLRFTGLWVLVLAFLLSVCLIAAVPTANATSTEDPGSTVGDGSEGTPPENSDGNIPDGEGGEGNEGSQIPDGDGGENPGEEGGEGSEDPPSPGKQGLITEDGKTYFYNEDGTMFTGGLKDVSVFLISIAHRAVFAKRFYPSFPLFCLFLSRFSV